MIVKLKPSFLLNVLLCICLLTFKIEAFHLVAIETSPSMAKMMSTLSSLSGAHDVL